MDVCDRQPGGIPPHNGDCQKRDGRPAKDIYEVVAA
jgi:hypothetical protein